MSKAEFACPAWCKMLLHCVKYPQASVIGVLLGVKEGDVVKVNDAVPVSHINTTLIPTIELGLMMIDNYCTSRDLCIVGLYHANESLQDISNDALVCRVGEKVASQFPDCVLVTVDNRKVGNIDSNPVIISKFCAESRNWKSDGNRVVIENEEDTLGTLSTCIQSKVYRQLVDLDNHLDNPTLDFFNQHMESVLQ